MIKYLFFLIESEAYQIGITNNKISNAHKLKLLPCIDLKDTAYVRYSVKASKYLQFEQKEKGQH